MANSKNDGFDKINYLRSDLATPQFGYKGHLGEASRAVEPILVAFEKASASELPRRIGKTFKAQLETELRQLEKAGLRRIIRIIEPQLNSQQTNGNLGFTRWIDASREWRECEIIATVLERYVDANTGESIIENYDEKAVITVRQSRHIRASERKKNKNNDVYVREQYTCPSCGAALEHIADETDCPYCGARITFNFFDWQVDSFYLDMHKQNLLNNIKKVAAGAATSALEVSLEGAAKMAELLADAWDEQDKQSRTKAKNDNYLGAMLTIAALAIMLVVLAFLSLPLPAKIGVEAIVAALIVWSVVKYLKATDQARKKKKIVRYSDGYLRSCMYDIIWQSVDRENLVDFSIDDINIQSVENSESTTTLTVTAEVIKKTLADGPKIDVAAETVTMKLSRARYPERIKTKGKTMVEKDCPSCGANFEPDKQNCCSYCGYGLKMEGFVWRQAG